ncbi:MAG: tetratricopeptide repeat protein [Rhodothermales bacterium]|nr:tetratricopeptide repeat protein [Rhodothermales bacterium]
MPTERQPSGTTRVLFWAITLALPFVFLVLLESGLRIAGYGNAYPLFVELDEVGGFKIPNPEVAKRYFGNAPVVPTISQDSFRSPRPDSSFRLIVQGGSTAAGFPYYYEASFGDVVEDLLLTAYPESNTQVITTAMSAVNSYTLLDLADEIIAEEPDAILIYAGHNEFYGAMGVGSSQSFGSSISAKRLYLKLRSYRLVQLLQNSLARISAPNATEVAQKGTLMARMVGNQSIPIDSELYHAGISQFESNMDALLATYRQRDIPVFISTIFSNERDHHPFIGEPTADQRNKWQREQSDAADAVATGDTSRATQILVNALTIDSLAADPHFALAKLYLSAGDTSSARRHFLIARDKDQLRFRAPEEINNVIVDLASKHDATLVDVATAARAASSYGITGNDLLTEHLHPNLEGYRLIGRTFFESIVDSQLLGEEKVDADEIRLTNYASELDSLLGEFRIIQITASWPFQPIGKSTRPIDDLVPQNALEDLTKRVFKNETDRVTALNELLVAYQQRGQIDKAVKLLKNSAHRYQYLEPAQRATGAILAATGRPDEALSYFLLAQQLLKTPESAKMIGSIYLNAGDNEKAVEFLASAIELGDETQQAYFNLALGYYRLERWKPAAEVLDALLSRWPNHLEARRLQTAVNAQLNKA